MAQRLGFCKVSAPERYLRNYATVNIQHTGIMKTTVTIVYGGTYAVEPGYQIYTVDHSVSIATVAQIFPMSLPTPVLGTTHPQV